MSFTSGFFNSHNGDRVYDAEQMSTLFGGIITDGVFKNYPETGQHFNISVSGRNVTLGPGRAWLNDIWINNDANYTVRLDPLSQVQVNAGYERVDALYFKVDKSNAGRAGSVYVAKGTAAAPETATFVRMEDTAEVFYHIIAIFRVVPTGNTIGTWQNRIGRNDLDPYTPYIIGPMEAEAVWAELGNEVDSKVQEIISGYVSNQNSPLYTAAQAVPMVWLCSSDIPVTDGTEAVLEWTTSQPSNKLYPIFYGTSPYVGSRRPRPGDAVLGANGYYGIISRVIMIAGHSQNNAQIYTGYTVWVKGTGDCMARDYSYLVSFWGNGASSGCDRTYSEIKAAYDAGKVLRFRWTPEDALSENFDWNSAMVYSSMQFAFYGSGTTAFEFRYENIVPSSEDYESSSWDNVSCLIDSSDTVSITQSVM